MKNLFILFASTVAFGSVVFSAGHGLGKSHAEAQSIECKIARVTLESDAPEVNTRNLKPPYTVLVYHPVFETHFVPGILGAPGDVVYLPKPR